MIRNLFAGSDPDRRSNLSLNLIVHDVSKIERLKLKNL
jgi:hypothetical protein